MEPSQIGEHIREAVDQLYASLSLIDDYLESITDRDEALSFYGYLQDAVLELKCAADSAGHRCIDLVGSRFVQVPVPGGGIFKVSGGGKRTLYDNERVVSVLAERIRTVMGLAGIITEDGERGEAAPVIDAIVSKVAKATGATAPSFSGWRSTIAKELGIRLNDYAEVTTTPLVPRIEGRR